MSGQQEAFDVIIIGAGASGMAAAIACGKSRARVLLLDRQEKMGRKILATGNGKCNLTNRRQNPACYRSETPQRAWEIVSSFGRKRTEEFFKELGIYTREKDGYVYPYCEQASSVRMAFEEKILENPLLTFLPETKVLRTERSTRGFQVLVQSAAAAKKASLGRGKSSGKNALPERKKAAGKKVPPEREKTGEATEKIFFSKKLIVAAGGFAGPEFGCDGSGYRLAESFGHHVVKPLPALTALKSSAPFLKKVKGVRNQAGITLEIDGRTVAEEKGELQWTDYGISGVAVFQLSRFAIAALEEGKKVTLYFDFMPELSEEEKKTLFSSMGKTDKKKTMHSLLRSFFPEKLVPVILREAKISEGTSAGQLSEKEWDALTAAAGRFPLRINGYASYEKAQVTRGGVSLSELTDKLESRLHPGLFFVGETVDVDGTCGGYNLQWAFASGVLAGEAAGRKTP